MSRPTGEIARGQCHVLTPTKTPLFTITRNIPVTKRVPLSVTTRGFVTLKGGVCYVYMLHLIHYLKGTKQLMDTKSCVVCGTEFKSKRSDAQTCSPSCRVKLNRQKKEGPSFDMATIVGPPATAVSTLTSAGPTLSLEQQALVDEALAEPLAQIKAVKKAAAIISKLGYDLRPMSELPPTTFIPTGHDELDAIIKGFPRKRITEIYGPASTGKSTLMLQTIVTLPESMKVLYLDLENAIDAQRAHELGVTSPNVRIEAPMTLEDAGELVLEQIGNFDLIVFDSVASALVKTEDTNELGNANVGVKPRIMTSFMRKLVGPLARTTCAVVFINQEKPTIGDMYAPKWYTPGGKALEYAASMRLRLTSNKADRITREGSKVGKKVKAEITKNKVGTPDREAQFLITY